jgi:uncharacterized protein
LAPTTARCAAGGSQGPRRRPHRGAALGAIDNAETPDGVEIDAPASGKIANAVAGLGAAEVARRVLADEQIRDLLHAEIDERLSAAEEFTTGGHAERATMLHAEAAVLAELLGDV